MKRWLAPSIPELLFLALVAWLVAFTVTGDSTGMGLLRDSQTGYQIRVGEYVLRHHAVPTTDFLSFTKPGQPFFAWEWLAGIGSAELYLWGGLRAVVVVSALLLGLTVLIMVLHMAWRGANVLIAVFLIHLAIGASSIHYLARPHIFTLLFLAIALWMLDRDRKEPTRMIWLLAPMTALWANLHGGFFGLLASLGILVCGSAAEWSLSRFKDVAARARTVRLALVSVACAAASLLNPYGVQEHIHLIRFMRETWYLKLTEEYQPPNFLSAPGEYYAVLLAVGILVAIRLLWRREFGSGLLILAWAYESSRSMRHIPIYAIVVLPLLASELAALWSRWTSGKSPKTTAGLLNKIAADYQPSMSRVGLFTPLVAAAFLFFSFGLRYPSDFPEAVYPVKLINRHFAEIGKARVFTTDAWGHYLTFRYPEPYKIFIDGRCDFFGEAFTQKYLDAMNGLPGWQQTFRRYGVDMALIEPGVALAGRLRQQPGWHVVEKTSTAVLFAYSPVEAKLNSIESDSRPTSYNKPPSATTPAHGS